jgi:hypothetical protein
LKKAKQTGKAKLVSQHKHSSAAAHTRPRSNQKQKRGGKAAYLVQVEVDGRRRPGRRVAVDEAHAAAAVDGADDLLFLVFWGVCLVLGLGLFFGGVC